MDSNILIMDKSCLLSKTLSWEAKGLHSYLMGLCPETELQLSDLFNCSTNSIHSTRIIFNELIQTGIIQKQTQSKNEQAIIVNYVVYEVPKKSKKPKSTLNQSHKELTIEKEHTHGHLKLIHNYNHPPTANKTHQRMSFTLV